MPIQPNAPLTERQAAVLRAIKVMIAEHGMPPTLREIGAATGIKSTNGVRDHLVALERKGYIAMRGDGKTRGLRVLDGTERLKPGLPDAFDRLRDMLKKSALEEWEVRGRFTGLSVECAGLQVCSMPNTEAGMANAILIAELRNTVGELLERYDLLAVELERRLEEDRAFDREMAASDRALAELEARTPTHVLEAGDEFPGKVSEE